MTDQAGHIGYELIIVRRHEEEEHEGHSSAWKVAHADFMTAMMAFFLIMWLISVTDDEIRKGVSEYFNPIRLSQGQTELKGLNKPSTDSSKPGMRKGHADAITDVFNPMKLSQGLGDTKAVSQDASTLAAIEGDASADDAAAAVEAAGAAASASGAAFSGDGAAAAAAVASGPGGAKPGGAKVADEPASTGAGRAKAGAASAGPGGVKAIPGTEAAEGAAFRSPYALLDELAGQYRTDNPESTSSSSIVGDDRSFGVDGREVDRDPFDPVYWQLGTTPSSQTDDPGKPGMAQSPPGGARPDAAAAQAVNQMAALPTKAPDAYVTPPLVPAPSAPKVTPAPETPAKAPASAVSSTPAETSSATPDAAAKAAAAATPVAGPVAEATKVAAEAVDSAVMKVIATTLGPTRLPKVSVTATSEGVVINLTDDADFSMFAVGSAIPNAKVVVLLEALGKALAERKGDVVIRGYTDGRPFRSEVYDNWRLSAARAHMAYYMLVRGGLGEDRVARIEGHADHDLKVKGEPFAAENRRIEILLEETADGP